MRFGGQLQTLVPTLCRRVHGALAGLSVVLLMAPVSWAFRTVEDRSDVPDAAQVRWPFGVFEYRVHDDSEDSIGAESLAEASQAALAEWASADCARVLPVYSGTTPERAAPGDGRNTVEFVETDWDRLGYPTEATGATDVQFEEGDDGKWVITEADIYINAEYHVWSLEEEPDADERSLLGVLVHEAGHALGLLHPCEVDGEDGAPACDEEDLPDAIMSPYYDAAQTLPEADDYDALCYLYPPCDIEACEPGSICVGTECVPVDDGTDPDGGEGSGALRSNGARCRESNECKGGECLQGVGGGPVCTQSCGRGDPDCPNDWRCGRVEGRPVCIPPDRDNGCIVAPMTGRLRQDGSFRVWPAALFGVGLLTWRRRGFPRMARDRARGRRSRNRETLR